MMRKNVIDPCRLVAVLILREKLWETGDGYNASCFIRFIKIIMGFNVTYSTVGC
jgi:hypothetical protein